MGSFAGSLPHPPPQVHHRGGWISPGERRTDSDTLGGAGSGDRLESVALHGGLAELVFLDLAARGHGVFLDKVHVLGDLIVGDAFAAELFDVLGGQGRVAFTYYGGGDLFTVLLVGDAVNLDVGDLRVGIEELLD